MNTRDEKYAECSKFIGVHWRECPDCGERLREGVVGGDARFVCDPCSAYFSEAFLRGYQAGRFDCKGASESAVECTLPPSGWHCTRGAGHEGPCAAVRD